MNVNSIFTINNKQLPMSVLFTLKMHRLSINKATFELPRKIKNIMTNSQKRYKVVQ